MNHRELAVSLAEVVVAWNDGILSDTEAHRLLDELRQSWQTHCAAVHCRNDGNYRNADDYVIPPAPALKRKEKISSAIGAVLLGHRVGAVDVCQAEELIAELVECEAASLHAERLLANRANEYAAKNRISQYEGALDARD